MISLEILSDFNISIRNVVIYVLYEFIFNLIAKKRQT